MEIPLCFGSSQFERTAMRSLGLCDLSGLTKLGIKGSGAATWLAKQQVDVPDEIYHSRRLDDHGVVIQCARDEFFLESGIANDSVPSLSDRLDSSDEEIWKVQRQDATFFLIGSRAVQVLAQTCGVDFSRVTPHTLVLTRVAGTSCGVFADPVGNVSAYRIWVDSTYANYLWETLVQISSELDGHVVGAGCIYPELR